MCNKVDYEAPVRVSVGGVVEKSASVREAGDVFEDAGAGGGISVCVQVSEGVDLVEGMEGWGERLRRGGTERGW